MVACRLFSDGTVVTKFKKRFVLAGCLPHKEFHAGIRTFKLITLGFHLFELFDNLQHER